MEVHQFSASQAHECLVLIEVLDSTASQGHKFKVGDCSHDHGG